MRRFGGPLVAVAWIAVGGCGDPRPSPGVQLRGRAMGTTWEVTLHRVPPGSGESALRRAVSARLERLESQMSHWRPESEVSRFDRSRSTEFVTIPEELAEVLLAAREIALETGGALDVTAAPLVALWGFGPRGPGDGSPTDAEIAAARAHVGHGRLLVEWKKPARPRLRKTDPRVEIDLSAIAKGYAIDAVADLLEEMGVTDYLIELGGELRGRGRAPAGRPWSVGLETPDPRTVHGIRRVVPLADQAIATSGSYRQFRRDPGSAVTYSHIIDPRTGRPATADVVSVTVLADTAMRADALATALLVLGSDGGYRFARQRRIAATFVIERGGRWIELQTPEFPGLSTPPPGLLSGSPLRGLSPSAARRRGGKAE